ncbi:DUF72 domain-containing protein [Longispora sp. NPDC051575]|uniref:DUF72 domain-containing protein n=1 Tax=Longispora sp. NPDC051575 TaxID=3154943 RepID=UPI00343EB703
MGEIRIGTASWSNRTLLESGWYPRAADTPAKRLAHYADQFPIVEVDTTYHGPPAARTAALWAERTPPGFTFDVKAFSLLTGHPTQPDALSPDMRPTTGRRFVYPKDLSPRDYQEVWDRFLEGLDPLVDADKLGVVLFQYPPWFTYGDVNAWQLLEAAERCAPRRIAVEFRHASWFEGDRRAETLAFLRRHDLPLVCVDMPQGHRNSVPPVVEATADIAVVRFHGHSRQWANRDVDERYRYLYNDRQLSQWARHLRALAERTEEVHVLLNNCCADNAQRNAARLRELLGVVTIL